MSEPKEAGRVCFDSDAITERPAQRLDALEIDVEEVCDQIPTAATQCSL